MVDPLKVTSHLVRWSCKILLLCVIPCWRMLGPKIWGRWCTTPKSCMFDCRNMPLPQMGYCGKLGHLGQNDLNNLGMLGQKV